VCSSDLYALSGPDDIDAQLATAQEMLDRNAAGRVWVTSAALGARYAAQLYRGDMAQADATCDDLGRAARAGQWPAGLWYHERLCLQRRLLGGELAAAALQLPEARERGRRLRVGYANNVVDLLQAVVTIEQHGARAVSANIDMGQLLDLLPSSLISVRPSFARFLLAVGETSRAARVLEELALDDFTRVPKDIGYLNALCNLAVVAIQLGDRARAECLYALLLPYAAFNTPNVLFLFEGAVSHFLGMLAVFFKRDAAVAAHFDDALARNEAFGQRLQLTRTHDEYARWLATRTDRSSQARARELRKRGHQLATDHGQELLADRTKSA
jgi:hypothetical protein